MADKISLRGDTKANWELVNPILIEKEIVVEIDTNKLKIGDGVKNYTQLPYASSGANPKRYISKLTQSNGEGAPVSQDILINEIEENSFGISRNQTGKYTILKQTDFDLSKTTVNLINPTNTSDREFSTWFLSSNMWKLEAWFVSINGNGFVETPMDGLLDGCILEICLYD